MHSSKEPAAQATFLTNTVNNHTHFGLIAFAPLPKAY